MILTDCLSENEQYKDIAKMKRLLQCREDEVKAVYHEKELMDVLLTMCQKLEEHMTGTVIMSGELTYFIMQLCSGLQFYLFVLFP